MFCLRSHFGKIDEACEARFVCNRFEKAYCLYRPQILFSFSLSSSCFHDISDDLTTYMPFYIFLCVISPVMFEKLIVTQLYEKSPTFYGSQRFISIFTRARHWSLCSDPDSVHTLVSYFCSIHSDIFPSMPRSSKLSLLFGFSDKHFSMAVPSGSAV
jgi:hypothetical protein